jgi:hypothetical protein
MRWGPAGGQLGTQRLPAAAQGDCPGKFDAMKLTPATAYQFSARDCDAITCSLWSRPVRVTTARMKVDTGQVVLTLDGATSLGFATTTANGTFDTNVTIPANTAPGNHKIRAVNEGAVAETALMITGPAAAGRASISMVAVLKG